MMFICLARLGLSSDEALHTGTLIVTYKTDAQAERLERIRFWLKDDSGKQHLYPMGKAYVDDSINQTRMVVIEDLLPGKYTLEFLVPNTDGYFAEVPSRRVTIAKGDVAKIDQKIKPRTTYWERIPPPNNEPWMSTSLLQSENLEGETSWVDKREAASEKFNVVEEISRAEKNEQQAAVGKLIVSFDTQLSTSEAKKLRFKLIDSRGHPTVHPDADKDTEIPLRSGSMVVITNVPVGEYFLEFFIDGEEGNALLTTKPFSVETSKTKSVHQSLSLPDTSQTAEEPILSQSDSDIEKQNDEIVKPLTAESKTDDPLHSTYHLSVMANIPTAVFHLQNEEGTEHWNGKGRLHTFENLKPGTYKLSFSSYDPYFVPPGEKRIEIGESEENQVEAIFNSLGKLKIMANVEASKVAIDDTNYIQDRREAEISNGVGVVYLPEGEYRVTFSMSKNGRMPPQPVNISISALHTREINVYFSPPRLEPR